MRIYSLQHESGCNYSLLIVADIAKCTQFLGLLIEAGMLTANVVKHHWGFRNNIAPIIILGGIVFCKALSCVIGLKVHLLLAEVRQNIEQRSKKAVAKACYIADQYTGHTIQGYIKSRFIDSRLVWMDVKRPMQKLAFIVGTIAAAIFFNTFNNNENPNNLEAHIVVWCIIFALVAGIGSILINDRRADEILSEMVVTNESQPILLSTEGEL